MVKITKEEGLLLQQNLRKEFIMQHSEAKPYLYKLLDTPLMSTKMAVHLTKKKFEDEYLVWLIYKKNHHPTSPKTRAKAKILREAIKLKQEGSNEKSSHDK